MIQRDIEYSGQFSKDVKLAQKRHKDMNKLKYLMTLLSIILYCFGNAANLLI